MSFVRFLAWFALSGALIPLMFKVVGWLIDAYQPANFPLRVVTLKLMLMLWPTSLMTLPASDEPWFETRLFLISLVVNAVFYSLVGVFIWLGINKHMGFLVLFAVAIIALWWRLLTL